MGIKTTAWIFKRQISEIALMTVWTPPNGNFNRKTESLQKAAQNNAMRTNYI